MVYKTLKQIHQWFIDVYLQPLENLTSSNKESSSPMEKIVSYSINSPGNVIFET